MSKYQENNKQQIEEKDSILLQAMFFSICCAQGILYTISPTMPYIYNQLPSYSQLSLFYASLIPWCSKFAVSPFLQKYTSMEYGKRKTWILISTFGSAMTLILASFYTDFSDATMLAWILIANSTFIAINNLSADSYAIKQFINKEKIGVYETIGDIGGLALGSLLLMKMTNFQFAQRLGYDGPFTTASTIFRVYATLLLIAIIPIHFFFEQKRLKCEDVSNAQNLCTIISYNKVFFHCKSKYFRVAMFALLYHQAINFYFAGFEYQLIGKGFSKDTYNSIENILIIVSAIIAYFLEGLEIDRTKFYIFTTLIVLANMALMTIYLPLNPWIVFFSTFLNEFAYTWRKIMLYEIINTFPIHGVAGMYQTTLTSLGMLGQIRTPHSLLISAFGFSTCMMFATIYQILIILLIVIIFGWIQGGEISIDSDLLEVNEQVKQNDCIQSA